MLLFLQLTGLSKILANEMGPPLRNLTVLPLLLSPERDESLYQLTDGRISVISHDVVPDYLRTKPEPAAEQRMLQHEQKVIKILNAQLVFFCAECCFICGRLIIFSPKLQ